MASSLIAGAVSLMLILISGYVIVTGILTISDTMIYTLTDVSALQERTLHSNINITSHSEPLVAFEIQIENTGDTIYSAREMDKMDLYLCIGGIINKYDPNSKTLTNDKINVNMWDPGEVLTVTYSSSDVTWAKFVTSNGVSDSTYI